MFLSFVEHFIQRTMGPSPGHFRISLTFSYVAKKLKVISSPDILFNCSFARHLNFSPDMTSKSDGFCVLCGMIGFCTILHILVSPLITAHQSTSLSQFSSTILTKNFLGGISEKHTPETKRECNNPS